MTERPRRDLAWVVALVFLLFWAGFAHTRAYSANEHSRLAAIEALVERGVWAIDDSRFGTIDKIRVGEHYYSDKPPLMALAGASPRACSPAPATACITCLATTWAARRRRST